MKLIILITVLTASSFLYAESTPEKTLELKAHVVKMMMTKDKLFRLELREHAAAYMAEEQYEPCLQQAMKENREVALKVTAYSLKVQECTLMEKEKTKAKN